MEKNTFSSYVDRIREGECEDAIKQSETNCAASGTTGISTVNPSHWKKASNSFMLLWHLFYSYGSSDHFNLASVIKTHYECARMSEPNLIFSSNLCKAPVDLIMKTICFESCRHRPLAFFSLWPVCPAVTNNPLPVPWRLPASPTDYVTQKYFSLSWLLLSFVPFRW